MTWKTHWWRSWYSLLHAHSYTGDYMLLSSLNLSQTFPNVESWLRIFLCLIVSNSSVEGNFSKFGKVKEELRGRKDYKHAGADECWAELHTIRSLDGTALNTIEEFALAKTWIAAAIKAPWLVSLRAHVCCLIISTIQAISANNSWDKTYDTR